MPTSRESSEGEQHYRTAEPDQPMGGELKPDPYVERMRPDPGRIDEPPVKLIGFLGRDVEAGFWRVYTTASLDAYVRIAESDVLMHHADETTKPGPGRTVLYVRQDAILQHVAVTTGRRQMQSEFLQGELTRDLLDGTIGQPGLVTALGPTVVISVIATIVATITRHLPSQATPCDPDGPILVTLRAVCPQ